MRWPWQQKNHAESRAAHRKAEATLQETRRRTHEVRATADVLRELRRRNRFAEQIELIYRDGR